MIKFYKTSSPEQVATLLAGRILDQLGKGRSVLWLISGGSAIQIAVLAAKLLKQSDLANLSISLVDERYGQTGHKDSNWQQLLRAGFRLEGASLNPILTGQTIEETTASYNIFLKNSITDYKVGLLGMGGDGHTAGILPNSPVFNSDDYAASYSGPDYQRITISPKYLVLLDEAVLFAQGNSKAKALADLQTNLGVNDQPAQILKQIPRVAIYNDLMGERI